ncbi:hypothetical protein GCM10011583_25150 [Streptomyces camponoticapitis]|uniref:Reductase n=2 Tax=Streptomyces camponoticapitis TaxID=1616125 RepID=A0ABQ2E5V6_9ACTN|nr:hypothetical protein GCM10011583_25150 [Streptomyces camponoticapitis]
MWWLSRIARGGDVPAPGPADMSLQYIDVRDLATWTLDAVERGLSGPYNTASEYGHATMGRLLTTCVEATGNKARLRWIDPEDIAAVGVTPDAELPIWLPPGAYHDAIFRGDVTRAYETGLRCRPVEETVRDTWHWMLSPEGQRTPFPNYRPIGLDPAKEERLLRR